MIKEFAKKMVPDRALKRYRKFRNPEYDPESERLFLELQRLKNMEEHTSGDTWVFGGKTEFVDGRSTRNLYKMLFQDEFYRFKADSDSPLIIDAGANIGIGVLYFKKLYPRSRIMAYEADPDIFGVLTRNCADLTDVSVFNNAVWVDDSELQFYQFGSDGGHLKDVSSRVDDTSVQNIKAVRLRNLLDQPVDMLKIDIEGAEKSVIADCSDRLSNVRNLFVEYHSFTEQSQDLGAFLSVIENAGFRHHIISENDTRSPFVHRPVYNDKDLRLNIFAFRD